MPAKKDLFDQFMWLKVVMSAINTLTFGQVTLGMSIFEYAALIISRIEYSLDYTHFAEFGAAPDHVEIAITGSDGLTNLQMDQPEVYDAVSYSIVVSGAPATIELVQTPIVHDFSTMKGGGLIVPAQNVYIGMNTAGFAAVGSCVARVYYTVKSLQASDFIELVQRLRVLST